MMLNGSPFEAALRLLCEATAPVARWLIVLVSMFMALVVDAYGATVVSVSSTTPHGAYKADDQIAVVVTFSDPVDVTGTPQLTLETGAVDAILSGTAGLGVTQITFTYTVSPGDFSLALDYINSTALTVSDGTILNSTTQDTADLTLPSPGAAGSLAANTDLVIDTTAPEVTLSLLTTTPTNQLPIRVRISFSEAVQGLTAGDITVTNGSVSALTDNGGTFDADITATANDTVTIRVSEGAVSDVANNANPYSNEISVNYDSQPPYVTDVTSSPSTGTRRATQQLDVLVAFQEPVNVSTLGGTPRIQLATAPQSAVATYLSGTGTSTLTFRYTVAAGENSTRIDYAAPGEIELMGGTIADSAGNAAGLSLPAPGGAGSLFANSTVNIDTTSPTVSITASSTTSLDTIPVTIEFSESMSGFVLSDVSVINGCATNFRTISGSIYEIDVIPRAPGIVSINVAASVALDEAGNPNLAATQADIDFQTSAPYVLSVTSPVTGPGSPTLDGAFRAGQSVQVDIVFSEAVSVSGGTPGLSLNSGGSASLVGGTDTNTLSFSYTVAAGQNADDLDYGTLPALSLNGASIRDSATGLLDVAKTFACPGAAGSLGSNKNIRIDTVAPTVDRVTSSTPNGSYRAGTNIPIQVQVSEAVTVTGGTPTLTLEFGATDTVVNYSSLGTNELIFNYVVAAGENSTDLNYTSISPFDLNGATIADAAGNVLGSLPSSASDNSLGGQKNLVIDTIAPVIARITSTSANASYRAGQSINVRAQFTNGSGGAAENVFVVNGSPNPIRIDLATGPGGRVGSANYAGGTGSSNINFTYSVVSGDNTIDQPAPFGVPIDLDYTSTSALVIPVGRSIRDLAGNDAIVTLAAPGQPNSLSDTKNIRLDTTLPTIVSVSSTTPNGIYRAGELIPIQITFSESVTVTGSPQLTLNTTSTAGSAVYSTGSPGTTLTFNYTVAANQNSTDLDYSSTTALTLPGGATIRDIALNDASTTLATPGQSGSLGFSSNIAIDTTVPRVLEVTSSNANGAYKAGDIIDISITMSEPVQLTGTASLLLASSPARSATCSSIESDVILRCSYTVQAGHTTNDLDYVATSSLTLLAGATLIDPAGNSADLTLASPGTVGSLGNAKNIEIDTTPPTVVLDSSSTPSTSISPIPVTIQFSEPVSGLQLADFSVTNGSVQGLTGSGTNYTVEVVPATQGEVTLTVLAGAAVDAALNLNPASNTLSRIYDTGRPSVTLTSTLPAISAQPIIPIEVSFSSSVTGFEASDIHVSNGTVTSFSGSGSTYTVQVTADADGLVTVSVPADSATDDAANGNTVSAALERTIDRTAAQVQEVTSTNSDGAYKAGDLITISVVFNEPVVVTGTTRLLLASGPTQGTAVCTSVVSNSTLRCLYTAQSGDATSDLDYVAVDSLSLDAGATLVDLADNPVSLTLASPGAAGSLSGTKSITLDTLPPEPPSVVSPTSGVLLRTNGLTISGTSEGDASVKLVDAQANTLCVAAAASDGAWSCTAVNLRDGQYTVAVKAEDEAGNISTPTELKFTVDTIEPASPVFSAPTQGATTESLPAFAGSAQPGLLVRIQLDGRDLCTVVADETGNWACTSAVELPLGRYKITGIAEDPDDLLQSPATEFTLTVGLKFQGRVAVANRSGEPLSGVLMSNGIDSAETALDGTYSLITPDQTDSNFTATKPGWRIYRIAQAAQEMVAQTVGSTWNAVPALDRESYIVWNNVLSSFKPALRVLNRSGVPQKVGVTLYREDGSECPDQVFDTAPPLHFVTLPLHTTSCFQEVAQPRLVKLTYDGGDYDAEFVVQRGQALNTSFSSLVTLPLANTVRGKTYVFVDNAYQRTRGGERTFVMRNELLLSNVSSSTKRFTVRRFQSDTTLAKMESVVIPPYGSVIVEFPSEGELRPENGLQEIDPEDPTAPYVAVLVRRGEQRVRPPKRFDVFLLMDYSRTGIMRDIFMRVQHLSRETAIQYAEIANVGTQGVNVEIVPILSNGRTRPPIALRLNPRETRKVRLSRLLGSSREGVVHISGDVPDSLLANSVVKHYQEDRDLLSIKALPLHQAIGDTLYGMYQRYGRTKSMLKLSNIGSSKVVGSVTCYVGSRPMDVKRFDAEPEDLIEVALERCFKGRRNGILELNTSQPGVVVADTLVYRRRNGINLPGRLR